MTKVLLFMTDNDLELTEATEYLQRTDGTLAEIIARCGRCQLRYEPNVWQSLSRSVISQMLSVGAAAAIRNRFIALGDGKYPTPEKVLLLEDSDLRSAGLSRNKVRSLRDIAGYVKNGELAISELNQLPNEEVITKLLPIYGIGRWTAEMFLIFCLRRLDVMSTGDVGLQNAMKNLYDLPARPTPQRMLEIAEMWKPYRSVASWYLWKSLDVVPQ